MIKDVLYNVEGTKHWTPDPDITPEQLEEMRVDVLERIIVARVGLLLRHPFFGNMATRLRILAADEWCPTAAVDGRNLYFNTQFFNKMNNKEIEFVIAHEILHCVFDHLGRREGRDPKLYNIAADYIVNNLLVRDRIGEKPSFIDCFQDFKYDTWTSEEVYDDIYEQAKQNGKTF
jgi:predicted metal-dependent peptidase